ncbi:hypothetical protein L211DRAFT_854696, partial [Terfezia boudieri ATCC MYA-4762]
NHPTRGSVRRSTSHYATTRSYQEKEGHRCDYRPIAPSAPAKNTGDTNPRGYTDFGQNIHDLNFRLRVAGTPPSRIWKECVLYTIDLTSLDKEFELELIINAYFATLEQQKSGLAAWLKMNDDIQHLKGIIRGMAGELLRLDGISN